MKKLVVALSYVLVAVTVFCATSAYFIVNMRNPAEVPDSYTKLEQLEDLIEERFIGEVDLTALEDSTAVGMVAALEDEWSYYISAAEYQSYMEQVQNAYVGVGITITQTEDGHEEVIKVERGGPAEEAGILPGDIVIAVEGQDTAELGLDGTRDVVRGEAGTFVEMTILRGEEELTRDVERRYIEIAVAEYEML